jgi:cardiolipin synthase A/B
VNAPRTSRKLRQTGGRVPAVLLSGTLLLALAACNTVMPRARADLSVHQAVPARPGVQAVAKEVSVTGRRGRAMGQQERAQLITKVGQQGASPLLNRHLAAMSAFDDVDLYAHNLATLLIDGPTTFASMFEAIERARHTVLLQSYILEDSSVADRLTELLVRKQAQGVKIALLYDAVGSIGTSEPFERLHAAGIPTCAFNPISPLTRPGYWDIAHRDHRKILSVDRQVGFTGGINISEVYSSGSFGGSKSGKSRKDAGGGNSDDAGWRDTQIRLAGPAAVRLDDLVRASWVKQGCKGDLPPQPPPAPSPAATRSPTAAATGPSAPEQMVRIVASSPDDDASRIYAMLLTAIDASQRSVYMTMAYFAPGEEMIDALCDAAGRGVDVQLVLPSKSDFSPVLHAGRSYYQRLLEAGVKIYELQDAVLHAKTAVIDGVVSTVGSSNLDWRSFTSNDEVNAVVFGEDFGDAMTRMFRQDQANSRRVTPEAWAERPLLQRTKETFARLFERLW